MTTTYVILFQVRPGRETAFLGLLEGVLDAMRTEETFHNAVLHRDPQDPMRFLLYETWADHQEVLDVQLHREYRRAYEAALPELLAMPRQIGIWQPMRADFAQCPGNGDVRPSSRGCRFAPCIDQTRIACGKTADPPAVQP